MDAAFYLQACWVDFAATIKVLYKLFSFFDYLNNLTFVWYEIITNAHNQVATPVQKLAWSSVHLNP
jgi:hypothetical protein